jgi:phosphoglucosamine mutase
MELFFGTDGIREKYPFLNELNSFLISYFFINKINKQDVTDIYIGYDTRFSSLSLALACASSITSFFNKYNINKKVILSNSFTSTPLIAFISNYKRSYSIQITASHNPFFYNGIKIFNKFGQKIDNQLEKLIESDLNKAINSKFVEIYKSLQFDMNNQGLIYSDNNLNKFEFKDFSKIYINNLLSFFKRFLKKNKLKPLKSLENKKILIILDLGNSAISTLAPKIYSKFLNLINTQTKLQIYLKIINNNPNGYNINYKCGSVNYENLKAQILKFSSDYDLVVGFTYDGDADRTLAFVNLNFNKLLFLDGDLIILALVYFLNKLKYNIKKVALTHMSNLAIEEKFNEMGVKVLRVNVGDKYITQAIEEGKAQIGAENSGHVVIPLFLKTGDGLFTSLFLLSALLINFHEIINLIDSIKFYPQKLINIKVSNKIEFMEKNKELFEKIEKMVYKNGRVFIRPSGTEDLIRILIETYNQNLINQIEEIINKEVVLNV